MQSLDLHFMTQNKCTNFLNVFFKNYNALVSSNLQHWLKIVSIIHYLHFSGLVWIPVFAASWYSCMPTISITGSYNNKPAFILNYGPLTLNNCLAQPENCYNYYLLRHVEVLMVSVVCKYLFFM